MERMLSVRTPEGAADGLTPPPPARVKEVGAPTTPKFSIQSHFTSIPIWRLVLQFCDYHIMAQFCDCLTNALFRID